MSALIDWLIIAGFGVYFGWLFVEALA